MHILVFWWELCLSWLSVVKLMNFKLLMMVMLVRFFDARLWIMIALLRRDKCVEGRCPW